MSDMHVRGCDCDECCPGTPAVATRVYQTGWAKGDGDRCPRDRKAELFPVRYDRRPLWERAVDRRAG